MKENSVMYFGMDIELHTYSVTHIKVHHKKTNDGTPINSQCKPSPKTSVAYNTYMHSIFNIHAFKQKDLYRPVP